MLLRFVRIEEVYGAVLPPHGKGQMNYDKPQGNERFGQEIRARVGSNPTAPHLLLIYKCFHVDKRIG